MSEQFLIFSKSRSKGIAIWWRPNCAGYTNDIRYAGRYSDDESASIVKGSPLKDMRVPVSMVLELANRLIVDLGDANNAARLNELAAPSTTKDRSSGALSNSDEVK